MNNLEVFERYNKAIQSIYGSRLMIQILLSVEEGGTPLSTLREITGSTSQALIPKIRKLESLSLVEARGPGYAPTTFGRIVAQKIGDFSLTMGTLTAHLKFWEDHDISTIPWPLLERIGCLLNAEVVFDTGTDIMHVYYHFLQLLSEAKQIAGVSAIMSPGLAETLGRRVIEGVPVDLLVNPVTIALLEKEPYRLAGERPGRIRQLPCLGHRTADRVRSHRHRFRRLARVLQAGCPDLRQFDRHLLP